MKHSCLPVDRLFYYYFNIGNSEKLLNLDFDPLPRLFRLNDACWLIFLAVNWIFQWLYIDNDHYYCTEINMWRKKRSQIVFQMNSWKSSPNTPRLAHVLLLQRWQNMLISDTWRIRCFVGVVWASLRIPKVSRENILLKVVSTVQVCMRCVWLSLLFLPFSISPSFLIPSLLPTVLLQLALLRVLFCFIVCNSCST